MSTSQTVGVEEALRRVLARVSPLPREIVPLDLCAGRIVAETVCARVDCPSADVSRMDGYAVNASGIASASAEKPVGLEIVGMAAAGQAECDLRIVPSETVRVLTGAPIPRNADTVIAQECVRVEGSRIWVERHVPSGTNIVSRGSDLSEGQPVAGVRQRISPAHAGLLAAAGHDRVPVVRNPHIAIVATGDEVVAPGERIGRGQVYASNLLALSAWCRICGWRVAPFMVPDDPEKISEAIQSAVDSSDALITCGGTMNGDRDYVVRILEGLGWEDEFESIRMIPGKAVGFGSLRRKPVFVLPGAPSANLMGFLQVALPGLRQMAGHPDPELPKIQVRLTQELAGRHTECTRFVYGTIDAGTVPPGFHTIRCKSRLLSMAMAQAIAAIPEGVRHLPAGTVIYAQSLSSGDPLPCDGGGRLM